MNDLITKAKYDGWLDKIEMEIEPQLTINRNMSGVQRPAIVPG